MKIAHYNFTKRFNKQFVRLSTRRQAKVRETLRLATTDLTNPTLRLHQLNGEYLGTYSISAGGDLRIHMELTDDNGNITADLQSIGTHSQLYG